MALIQLFTGWEPRLTSSVSFQPVPLQQMILYFGLLTVLLSGLSTSVIGKEVLRCRPKFTNLTLPRLRVDGVDSKVSIRLELEALPGLAAYQSSRKLQFK